MASDSLKPVVALIGFVIVTIFVVVGAATNVFVCKPDTASLPSVECSWTLFRYVYVGPSFAGFSVQPSGESTRLFITATNFGDTTNVTTTETTDIQTTTAITAPPATTDVPPQTTVDPQPPTQTTVVSSGTYITSSATETPTVTETPNGNVTATSTTVTEQPTSNVTETTPAYNTTATTSTVTNVTATTASTTTTAIPTTTTAPPNPSNYTHIDVSTDGISCVGIKSRLKAMAAFAVITCMASCVGLLAALLLFLGQEHCGTRLHNSSILMVVCGIAFVGSFLTWVLGSNIYWVAFEGVYVDVAINNGTTTESISTCPTESFKNSPLNIVYGTGWILPFISWLLFAALGFVAYSFDRSGSVGGGGYAEYGAVPFAHVAPAPAGYYHQQGHATHGSVNYQQHQHQQPLTR